MLTLKTINDNPEEVILKLAKKHFDAKELVYKVLDEDKRRKETQSELDGLLSEVNSKSKSIGALMKEGKKEEAESQRLFVQEVKVRIQMLEGTLKDSERELQEMLVLMPNLPADIVPEGRAAEDNIEVKTGGEVPGLSEDALPHWDLAKKYDLIDFELGVKISGAGFPVYKGKGARLQRALINFFLDKARDAGYLEVQPPYVVNAASGYGTGQLPDKEGQMYHATADDLYLIPTAEVPVTNIYRDTILEEKELPIKNTAYSACFRREAGSYGKDVRGLNRLHQFEKVEIVRIEKPENSYAALDGMIEHVKGILEDLELPYRILRLCGGDTGFTSAITYDFEVFSEAQEKWLEVSSVSNFETFQANRLKLRYKDENGTQLAHSLNGSALALPRILASILENHQQADGTVKIPKALQPYTRFEILD